jgi:hypothetical protein
MGTPLPGPSLETTSWLSDGRRRFDRLGPALPPGWMRIALLVIVGTILLLVAGMAASALRDPVVRSFRYARDDWPASSPPRRLVLLTDLHVSGPDMGPARLARIVDQVNALRPDLVLLGGDFISASKAVSRRYAPAQAIAPLANLKAQEGVIAVMGNHDHWSDVDTIRRALAQAGVTVLDNSAVRRGPLVIGGVDDAYTGHADVSAVAQRMQDIEGVPVLLSHSPDVFPDTPASVGLVLAGHTHCGQIAPPLVGPLATMSRYGKRFACGVVRRGGQILIVSAGLGTSIAPLRLNTPPDIWMIEAGPANP